MKLLGTSPEGLFSRAGRTGSPHVSSEPAPAPARLCFRDGAGVETQEKKPPLGSELQTHDNRGTGTGPGCCNPAQRRSGGPGEHGSCPGRACRQDGCQAVPTGSCLWKRARRRAGGQGQPAARASPTTHSAGRRPPPGGTIAPFTSAEAGGGVTCGDGATVPRVPPRAEQPGKSRGEAQQRAPPRRRQGEPACNTRQRATLARGHRARQRQSVPRILFSLPSPGTGSLGQAASCPAASVSPAPRS